MAEVKRPPQQQTLPERKHGILYNLLWGWPWALVGVVLSSLLLSLLIESYRHRLLLAGSRGGAQ